MTTIFLICEHLEPESLMRSLPPWKRIFWAMEMGLETVVTGGTSEEVKSQFARSMRMIIAITGMIYIMNIFGAVITSQLTASQLGASKATEKDVRNTRLAAASQSSTMLEYMEGLQVGATIVDVPNVEEFAIEFYKGGHPTFDGYVAAAEVADFLHNQAGGESHGYTLTDSFQPTGSADLRAFPFANNGNDTVLDQFNIAIQQMRRAGHITELQNKWITSAAVASNTDFAVPEPAFTAIRIFCIVFICLFSVCVGILFVIGLLRPAPEETPDRSLRWRGRSVDVSERMEAVMDALAAQLQKEQAEAEEAKEEPERAEPKS